MAMTLPSGPTSPDARSEKPDVRTDIDEDVSGLESLLNAVGEVRFPRAEEIDVSVNEIFSTPGKCGSVEGSGPDGTRAKREVVQHPFPAERVPGIAYVQSRRGNQCVADGDLQRLHGAFEHPSALRKGRGPGTGTSMGSLVYTPGPRKVHTGIFSDRRSVRFLRRSLRKHKYANNDEREQNGRCGEAA